MFKKLLKISIIALSFFGMSTVAMACSLETTTNVPVLQAAAKEAGGSWSSYTKNLTVEEGDLVVFHIHARVEGCGTADNVLHKLEDIRNEEFDAGSETVTGYVDADNASRLNDSVRLTFRDDVKMVLHSDPFDVFKKNEEGNSSEFEITSGSASSIFSSGKNVGDVDDGYRTNLLVYFTAVPNGGNSHEPSDDIEVSTNSATSIDEDSARLNGEVDEGDDVEVWFAISENSNPSCSSSSQREDVSGDRDEGDSFSVTVNNLDEDTRYYFRACGENNDGEDSGSIRSFTTDDNSSNDDELEVSTNSATSIDEDSAIIEGEITEGNNATGWLIISDDRDDVDCDYRSTDFYYNLDEGDEFRERISGLDSDETYYYRACAVNNNNTDEGSIRSFKTDDDGGSSNNDDIEVSTESATDIEDTSARLRGELEEGDDAEVWFALASEFGSSPSCSNSSQREDVNGEYDNGDEFFVRVAGLEEDTKYFYRACAEDDNGDDSGEIRTFETDGGSDNGEVSTLSPTSVTDDSARLNGRLEEGDDLEVWFALSRTDSTPSCSNSSQREDVSGKFDDGDLFSEVVTNLRDNSTYYYRACAEDEDGEDVFGSIRTFVTGNGGTTNLQSALTGSATSVGTVSARVNGVVSGTGSGECYFNYGTSTSVPLKTSDVSVNGSQSCSSFLSGLSPNTTYYYQAVLERDGVVRKGAIRSFRTSSNLPPVVINNPPVVTNPNPGTTVIRVVDRVNQDEEDLGVTKWVSGEFDDDFVTAIDAKRGEVVFYRVLVRNNTNEDLEDIKVTDRIPFELELANNDDIDDDSDKQLVWDIDELEPGESKIFITEMRVREDTPIGLEIISFASAEAGDFETDSNNVLIEVEGGSIVDEDDNGQSASIFGAGFFPQSLIGWLILIAVLIAIAYLVSRLLFSRKESHKLNAELAALEAERIRNLR